MNAALSILARPERVSAISKPRGASASIAAKASYGWSAEEFAEEQVQSLVQQLFYVGARRPARQVVLSGMLADQRIGSLCVKIGRTLAASGAFNVCVVEADLRTRSMQIEFGGTSTDGREIPERTLDSRLRVHPCRVYPGLGHDGHLALRPAIERTVGRGPDKASLC